jgi:hypothetical protein
MPSAMPEELAFAVIETVNAGARLIILSAAVERPSTKGEHELEEAFKLCRHAQRNPWDFALRRNVVRYVSQQDTQCEE